LASSGCGAGELGGGEGGSSGEFGRESAAGEAGRVLGFDDGAGDGVSECGEKNSASLCACKKLSTLGVVNGD
jgi:hypothetical protein